MDALKTSWSQVQEEHEEQSLSSALEATIIDGPSILSGGAGPIDIPELLASLPEKSVADKLLALFFDEKDNLVPSLRKYLGSK